MQNYSRGIEIVIYSLEQKESWDAFVRTAKNGHFFFHRDFMEYHADRFRDFSLLFYDKEKLIGLLPANRIGAAVYSHQGLSHGGILCDDSMTASLMLMLFKEMIAFLRTQGVVRLVYKAMPYIYFRNPAEEDRYALFVHGGRLVQRDLSSALAFDANNRYTKGKRANISKAKKEGLQIKRTVDYPRFMGILEDVLRRRHNTQPTHSAGEMCLLADRFPENIKLYAAFRRDEMLAGAVLFENETVVHTQYLANTDAGKEIGALDYLIDYLIDIYQHKRYMSFGISTAKDGELLNLGLVASKEGFGARAVVHDCYELDLT